LPRSVIRVGIADDRPGEREVLIELLDSVDDVVVVGEASDGNEALRLADAEAGEPDVILLDAAMSDVSGLEVARALNERHPSVGVIMLTAYEDDQHVTEAVKAGARGYVLRSGASEDLIHAIRLVAGGHLVIDARFAEVVAGRKTEAPRTRSRRKDVLTEREVEVVQLLGARLRDEEIAERLGINLETVERRLQRIVPKLGAVDRAGAVAAAVRRRYLLGHGRGYWGIWDQRHPGAPVRTFREREASEAWLSYSSMEGAYESKVFRWRLRRRWRRRRTA
jgi:DNA-binding NarL/FixJ family response regulator